MPYFFFWGGGVITATKEIGGYKQTKEGIHNAVPFYL